MGFTPIRHQVLKNTPPNIVLRLVTTASHWDRHPHRPPDAPGFGALKGSAASEGVFASSLDVR
jgi:hypothetical protein